MERWHARGWTMFLAMRCWRGTLRTHDCSGIRIGRTTSEQTRVEFNENTDLSKRDDHLTEIAA